jgi:acyl-CoA reductase-like NAD-dependent aldehyde dehydrogenase
MVAVPFNIADPFEHTVDVVPDGVAVVDSGTRLTYRGLDARGNQIDHDLASEDVGSTPEGTAAEMERAVATARAALDSGPRTGSTAVDRHQVMGNLPATMNEHSEELANLMAAEVGTTILFSRFGQIGAASMMLGYFTNLVNGYAMEWSSPFGGYKNLGLGRELGPEGLEGHLEYKPINMPAGTEPTVRY